MTGVCISAVGGRRVGTTVMLEDMLKGWYQCCWTSTGVTEGR